MSPDPVFRDLSVEMNATYGYGAELNYKPNIFNLDILFYLSAEYMKIEQDNSEYKVDNGFNISTFFVHEKFTLVPVELGIKWPLPVGTDNFKIYIGGGGGFYFGSHKRTYGSLESRPVENKPGFSLNILSGLEYYFMKNVSADFELKFREASFDTQGSYNKKQFQLPDPFYSRLIVDGVRVSAGFKYHF
jgi:opacity protein-like surface antigen